MVRLEVHNGHMSQRIPQSMIVHLPYGSFDQGEVESSLLQRDINMVTGDESQIEVVTKLLFGFPAVYVVHTMDRNRDSANLSYSVYVGETNNIRTRTFQHLQSDVPVRKDWNAFAKRLARDPDSVWQYIIGNPHFNKSLTLDIENQLMHYLLGVLSVGNLNNRRSNAQGDYYTRDEFDKIFNDIWLQLHRQDPSLFPSEQIIRDSALFKASPFHALTDEQKAAEESILSVVADLVREQRHTQNNESTEPTKLIVVQGAAGTGKTVLLSHLFYRISTELGLNNQLEENDDEDQFESSDHGIQQSHLKNKRVKDRRNAYILVNHHEQEHIYNQIATKLGLQHMSEEVVLVPSTFINKFSKHRIDKNGKSTGRGIPDEPKGKVDIVLVDEGHLLLTQGNQGYSGKNQLHDILRRSKIVVLIFDPNQILQTAQQWDKSVLSRLISDDNEALEMDVSGSIASRFKPFEFCGDCYEISHIQLRQQFRIAASEPVIEWIDHFAGGVGIDKLPRDRGTYDKNGAMTRAPYEVKVFDSPVDLYEAIKRKASLTPDGVNGHGLSRVLATYDWKYTTGASNPNDADGHWNVELHRDSNGQWQMGLGEEGSLRFCKPWNLKAHSSNHQRSLDKDLVWAERPCTINEIGSTFTIQGFDLNFAGVIIGPSVIYRNGELMFNRAASQNYLATKRRNGKVDYSEQNLRNELNVLLKRGVHGLYLFAVDHELQKRLKEVSQ